MATATYDLIASQTLGSAAASITFSSIAASWTDLRLVLVATSSVASDWITVQFNSDTGTNYSYTYLDGDGSATHSASSTGSSYLSFGNSRGTASSTTIPDFTTIDIFAYAGSTYKTALANNNNDKNGSGVTKSSVGLWRSTSAINTVKVYYGGNGSNMNTGTTAQLYGIKSA